MRKYIKITLITLVLIIPTSIFAQYVVQKIPVSTIGMLDKSNTYVPVSINQIAKLYLRLGFISSEGVLDNWEIKEYLDFENHPYFQLYISAEDKHRKMDIIFQLKKLDDEHYVLGNSYCVGKYPSGSVILTMSRNGSACSCSGTSSDITKTSGRYDYKDLQIALGLE